MYKIDICLIRKYSLPDEHMYQCDNDIVTVSRISRNDCYITMLCYMHETELI